MLFSLLGPLRAFLKGVIVPIGSVARFDCRRGYGFVIPDDGGEDVFVHQNNINMDGFRYLQPGERVSYELEVGEKGMKAVSVTLLEERREPEHRKQQGGGENRRKENGGRRNERSQHQHAAPAAAGDDRLEREVEKLRRKQERLISLLVEKNILSPGEIDGLPMDDDAGAAPSYDDGEDEIDPNDLLTNSLEDEADAAVADPAQAN